jgi:hypothetical protein
MIGSDAGPFDGQVYRVLGLPHIPPNACAANAWRACPMRSVKLTLPAARPGKDRGTVATGMAADLVLFDPDKVRTTRLISSRNSILLAALRLSTGRPSKIIISTQEHCLGSLGAKSVRQGNPIHHPRTRWPARDDINLVFVSFSSYSYSFQ